jgi:hypothetical protein
MYPTRDYFQLMQPIVHPFSPVSNFSQECGKPSGRMTRTPTDKVGFLVHGVPVGGAYPTEHFVGIIEELQKRRKVQI